jgi:hypothetical protein
MVLTVDYLSAHVGVDPDFFSQEIAAETVKGMNITSRPLQEDS